MSELLPAAKNVSIIGNTVRDPGLDGISLFECQDFAVSGNVITGATTASRGAIYCLNTTNNNCPANGLISGNTLKASTSGVRMQGGNNITIKGNQFIANGIGIVLTNRISTPLFAFITENDFIDNTTYGLIAEGTATFPQTAYIHGNTFFSSDIATKQATGAVSQGVNSNCYFGSNQWSPNYDTRFVETNFGNRATKAYLDLTSATFARMKPTNGIPKGVQVAYDPPSIAAGARVSTTVTVTGAVAGEFVRVEFSLPHAGITFQGTVSANNTVYVVVTNVTGGAIDLGAGTLTVEVTPA